MSARMLGSLVACGGLLLFVARSAPKQPAPESVRLIESIQAPALYTAYCAVCHGAAGKGDGPLAQSLKTAPIDLTRIAARNGGTYPLKSVVRIISGEQEIRGGHGTREMPVWGPIFSQVVWDQDLGQIRVYNLAKHIETLQVK
jgi:mono/diheme cytochrome c family protein